MLNYLFERDRMGNMNLDFHLLDQSLAVKDNETKKDSNGQMSVGPIHNVVDFQEKIG